MLRPALPALLLLLLASLVIPSCAQTVIINLTASMGDGSKCTGTQNPGSNVNFTFNCVEPVQGQPSSTHRIYEAGSLLVKVSHVEVVQFGDVICMFGVNPANYPVSFGSLLLMPMSVPPKSMGYTCATNTRTVGAVTGQVPGPSGIVTWPLTVSLARRLFDWITK